MASERTYAVALVFALTQGPVYSGWYASGKSTEFVPNPGMPLVHYATFMAVQIPALMLLGRRIDMLHFKSRGPRLFVAFLVWMNASTLWSVLSRQTVIESIALTVTAMCGLYLMVSFDIANRLQIIFLAMQVGVVASVFAVLRNWDLSTSDSGGYWIGIYLNRNSLAPVAAIGILAGVFLLPKWRCADPSLLSVGRLAIVAFVLLDAFVLWRSESTTSPVALGLATAGVVYWQVIRLMARRTDPGNFLVRASHLVYIAGITFGMWILFRVQGRLLAAVGETVDFNGRLAHWRFSWNGFVQQPWFGYGWQAAWRDPEFLKGTGWWELPNILQLVAPSGSLSYVVDPNRSWSHSGYFDVILGGGIVAGIVLVALVVVAVVSQQRRIIRGDATVWEMAVLWFVVAAASQESFIIGNHFMWLLLSAVLWSTTSAEHQYRGLQTT